RTHRLHHFHHRFYASFRWRLRHAAFVGDAFWTNAENNCFAGVTVHPSCHLVLHPDADSALCWLRTSCSLSPRRSRGERGRFDVGGSLLEVQCSSNSLRLRLSAGLRLKKKPV